MPKFLVIGAVRISPKRRVINVNDVNAGLKYIVQASIPKGKDDSLIETKLKIFSKESQPCALFLTDEGNAVRKN